MSSERVAADIEAIRALIADYVDACDNANFQSWRSTFLGQGSMSVMGDEYRGDDLDQLIRVRVDVKLRDQAEGRRTRHHLTSQRITVVAPTKAEAWTYFHHMRGGLIEESGVYLDSIVKGGDGAWKFLHREVVVEFRSDPSVDFERPKPVAL